MTRFRRALGFCLLAGVAVAAGGAAHVLRFSIEGDRAMTESDALFDQGKLRESLVQARRAAGLYVPGLGHVKRADARLDAIANGAEASHLPKIALLAWQAIRASELQRMQGFGLRPQRLALANARVSGLVAALGNENNGNLSSEERARTELSSRLEASSVSRNGEYAAQLGSVMAVLAGLLTMAMGQRREARYSKQLLVGAGLAIAGAVWWALCLAWG